MPHSPRVTRLAILVGVVRLTSLLLALFLAVCYALRPDAAAAVTLFPTWGWSTLGILLVLFTRAAGGRKIVAGLLGAWVVFTLVFAEEPASLMRAGATQQINNAYAVLLSSQFQGFCRDLHSECADYLVSSLAPISLQPAIRRAFTQVRKLDHGNPNPGNIGADFGRLDILFWPAVLAHDQRNAARQQLLEELNRWRNAIAHQDFDPAKLGGRGSLDLALVRRYRGACQQLALSFDDVMRAHIFRLTGAVPW